MENMQPNAFICIFRRGNEPSGGDAVTALVDPIGRA
jgi:RNA 3'-terminal phosphate cyclase